MRRRAMPRSIRTQLPWLEVPASDTHHDVIDTRLEAITRQPFRARFHLRGRERALVLLRGMGAIRAHAEELVGARVAPAQPRRDGKQTPYRGHPVFVAQHATATCCRGCLERNHQITRGHDLAPEEHAYVTDVIMRWIGREIPDAPQ